MAWASLAGAFHVVRGGGVRLGVVFRPTVHLRSSGLPQATNGRHGREFISADFGDIILNSRSGITYGVPGSGSCPRILRRCNAGPSRPTILVLGEERAGLTPLQRDLCSDFVRIPMIGAADSLNLAVAGSLLLYEVYRADGSDVASQTRRCGGGAIASPVLWRAEHSGVKLAVPGWMRRSVGEKACTGFGLRRACAQIRLTHEVGEIGQRLGLGCARGSASVQTSEELGKLRLARALPVIGRWQRLSLRSRGRLLHGAAEKPTEHHHGLHEDLQDNGKPVHEFGAVWKLARSRSTRCGPKMYSRCIAKHFLDSQALGQTTEGRWSRPALWPGRPVSMRFRCLV
jgi:hypothetical protein